MGTNSVENKSYYQMLGVGRDATESRIREVYRDLAKVYHPDSNFYDEIIPQELTPEQEAIFKVITCAYNTLVDPSKRAEYDKYLERVTLSEKVKTWDDETELMAACGRQTSRSKPVINGFGKPLYPTEEVGPQLRPAADGFQSRSLIWSGAVVGALVGGLVLALF